MLTFGAVVAGPLSPADALLQLQVELAVPGAVRQALPGLAVQLTAVDPAPALPAHARPGHAEPVAGARRIGAVGCKIRSVRETGWKTFGATPEKCLLATFPLDNTGAEVGMGMGIGSDSWVGIDFDFGSFIAWSILLG